MHTAPAPRSTKYVVGAAKNVRYSAAEWKMVQKLMAKEGLDYSKTNRAAFAQLARKHNLTWPED